MQLEIDVLDIVLVVLACFVMWKIIQGTRKEIKQWSDEQTHKKGKH